MASLLRIFVSSKEKRTARTLFYILDRMLGLIGAYYRGEADFSFFVVNTLVRFYHCLHRNMSGMYSQGRF